MKWFSFRNCAWIVLLLASIQSGPSLGDTKLLMHNLCRGNVSGVKNALIAGEDPNQELPKKYSPLTYSLEIYCSANLHVIRLLIKYGANVNERDGMGSTPLVAASRFGYTRVIRILLEEGAEINGTTSDGRTALMVFPNTGDNRTLEQVKLLLDAGADPNLLSNDGQSAYSWALTLRRDDVAELISNYTPDQ